MTAEVPLGPEVRAHVVTAKSVHHLPLRRLEHTFGPNGLEIARSALYVWCRDVAEIAQPLRRRMYERVRILRIVAIDDTVMPKQTAARAKPVRIWILISVGAGDDRHLCQVFDFTESRSRDGPRRFLASFRGTLLADA